MSTFAAADDQAPFPRDADMTTADHAWVRAQAEQERRRQPTPMRPGACWAQMAGTAEEQIRRALRPRRPAPTLDALARSIRRLARRLHRLEGVVADLLKNVGGRP